MILKIKAVSIILAMYLIHCSNVCAQQNNQLDQGIEQIRVLYKAEQYELAYDTLIRTYSSTFNTLNNDGQIMLLDWAIRLSFLSKDWEELDKYIREYYALDPYFSADVLAESSPQLKEYVGNFVQEQSEQYVYVNKHRQNIDLIPATVTVYSKEDIERIGARNLLDLIRVTPGFAELGDNNERVIGTRGSSNTTLQDVLFLINGHRISDILTTTSGPDWISLDYVEQVELARGPGSALYGGSAFSGVINIVTKNGRFKNFSELHAQFGSGNDFSDVGYLNNTYRLNYQVGRKISNTEGIFFSATFFQSGGSEIDYSRSNNKPILPDVLGGDTIRSADLDGIEYINRYGPGYNLLLNYNRQSLQITANAQSSTFLYSRPSSLNLWNSLDQDSLSNHRRRIDKRNFVQVEYDLLDNSAYSHNELRLKISGDHFRKDFNTNLYSFGINNDSRLLGDEHRGTIDIEFSSDSLLSSNGKRKNHILIGAEAFVNNWFYNYYTEMDTAMVLSKIGDQFTELGEPRQEYVAAAFIQTEQHLIADKLIATAGIRFNYHNIYSTFDEFNYGEQYSPRFALVYLPEKNKHNLHPYKFKLLYNSAFLPPPFLYRRGGIDQFVGTDNLKPQSIESGELVVYGDINKNFNYSALTYINKIDQNIRRVGDTYINELTDKRVSGYEMMLEYKTNSEKFDWSSFINYSFSKQQNFKDTSKVSYLQVFNSELYHPTDSLRRFPSALVSAGFNASFKKKRIFDDVGGSNRFEKFMIGATAQYIGASKIESNYFVNEQGLLERTTNAETQELPSSIVVNAQLKFYTNYFSIGASIHNLFNREYYLSSAVSAIQRQRAEGRMIYFNFSYYINK